MKKIELLSPVGDFECLKAAVQNGADSVYFGASSFNARVSATNFNLSGLKEAIRYAKLRGVNTHLTLNTLVKNNEFEDAVFLAKKAYEFGIDAIIVQDLGLATFLINNFPDLPIHASTQMTINNLDGVLEAEKLGFKRVVLSRELSLEEIEYICSRTSIEIETFIHGALCISYSGQCLFSSMIGGRSGNRGKCAQPCRLPYELVSKDLSFNKNISLINKGISNGYLLSTKDLCGLEFIPSLIKAGVTCFKIEGRMKKPEYVAITTKIYRKYIDLALSNKPYVIDENDKKDLLQVFNRGGFSSGHLDNKPNSSLVYPKKQNHIGIYIGNVSNLKPNKKHIFFNLKDSISIGDTIEFENEPTKYTISELMVKGKNVNLVNKKVLVEIGRMKGNIKIGDEIYKVSSKQLSENTKMSYKNENIKIKLLAKIKVFQGEPIELTVKTVNNSNSIFDNICVTKTSDLIPIKANNKPIDKDKISSSLNKIKDTIFLFDDIIIDLEENTFIPSISCLNALRRDCLDEILNIANDRITRKSNTLYLNFPNNNAKTINKKEISVLLNFIDENNNYLNLSNVNNIYIPLKYFYNKKLEQTLISICDNFNTYIYLPTVIKANYRNLLNNIIEKSITKYKIKGFVISNISSYQLIDKLEQLYPNKFEYISNYTLNVYNSFTENIITSLGVSKFTFSPESDSYILESVSNSSLSKCELIVYGRTPLMTTNYCLLGKTNKCFPTCGTKCMENKQYYLKDRLGFYFPVVPDSIQTVTTIYNSKISSIQGSNFNVSSYRIDILEESIDEINFIVKTILEGKRLEGEEYTNGNLNREI